MARTQKNKTKAPMSAEHHDHLVTEIRYFKGMAVLLLTMLLIVFFTFSLLFAAMYADMKIAYEHLSKSYTSLSESYESLMELDDHDAQYWEGWNEIDWDTFEFDEEADFGEDEEGLSDSE